MNTEILNVNHVNHRFGEKNILHDVNLRIASGQIVGLVGPSGCGKTTLLRAILGTNPPTEGTISTGGFVINKPSRNIGIVYQDYALFDFLNAEDNVAFGPMLDQTSMPFRFFNRWRKESWYKPFRENAQVLLQKMGLSSAIRKYPKEMSGGMRQRVAIAQAMAMKPKVLLLDEPFGALDEATREELQVMLLELYQENLHAQKSNIELPHTIVIVTHELNEAIYVSDRVIGLSQHHPSGNLGATICFDGVAPVHSPREPKNVDKFIEMRQRIRDAVFDPEKSDEDKTPYLTFWSDVNNGLGNGVMKNRSEHHASV